MSQPSAGPTQSKSAMWDRSRTNTNITIVTGLQSNTLGIRSYQKWKILQLQNLGLFSTLLLVQSQDSKEAKQEHVSKTITWWYKNDLALAVTTKHRNFSGAPCFKFLNSLEGLSESFTSAIGGENSLSSGEGKHGHAGISQIWSSSRVRRGEFACMISKYKKLHTWRLGHKTIDIIKRKKH